MSIKYSEELTAFLHQLNPWWKKPSSKLPINERPFYLDHLTNKSSKLIRILIGARRVGKTSILYSLVNKLLRQKVLAKNIIFLSGDLVELQQLGVRAIMEHIIKLHKLDLKTNKIHLIIDEVQEIENWQQEIKLYYDTANIQIYLSGSYTSILQKNTSKLTGRYQLIRVLALSFNEFIQFKKVKKVDNKILEQYLTQGGYPERLRNNLPGYLQDIIDSTLYRDLMGEYGIRTPEVLLDILKFLADKITTPVSYNRIGRDLGIDKNTAANYLRYLQAVYLIFPLYRNGGSNRKSKNFPPKYYFNDTGILKTLSIRTRLGHLAENAVYIEFLRRQYAKEHPQIFYDVIENQEYDFLVDETLYEVKTDPTFKALHQYELRGRFKQLLPKPTLITHQENIREIVNHGYDLDTIDIKNFLMGETKDLF